MPLDIVFRLVRRFAEFYHFSHRDFIYDAFAYNDAAMRLLTEATSGPWVDRPDMHLPIAVLNNGDCFVAALAVGEALRAQGFEVKYYANGGHYFISVRHYEKLQNAEPGVHPYTTFEVYYDTIYPLGKRSPEEMLRHHNPEIYKLETGDAQWLVERALEDAIDIEFIEQFVRFYDFDYAFPYRIPNAVGTNQWFYRNNNGAR